MNTATATAAEIDEVTPTDLGKRFIRWGLNLYLTGFFLGLVPVLHYMHGAVAGDIGGHFMKNMTLWWGCPAVLMELTLKTGGLGMLVVGLCYVVLPQGSGTTSVSKKERNAVNLCVFGLIGGTVYAAVGYVVCNMIWPNFYFEHNEMGKDVWLAGQGVGILVFIVGFMYVLTPLKRDYLRT
jgi:hypothetical protein